MKRTLELRNVVFHYDNLVSTNGGLQISKIGLGVEEYAISNEKKLVCNFEKIPRARGRTINIENRPHLELDGAVVVLLDAVYVEYEEGNGWVEAGSPNPANITLVW